MKQSVRLIPATLLLTIGCIGHAATPATPIATQWAKVNGVNLRYELTGTGSDTVVLLHEMSTSMETWDYVLPELTRQHRVLRYDLRGFGLSERIHGAITMDDEMQDLRALLENLNIRGKVTLIGGAIGGAIALKYAATYPEQVNAVVAISPAAYMKAKIGPNAPAATTTSSAAAASAVPSGNGALEAAYPVALQQAHPDRLAHFLAIQAAADPASSAATTPTAYAISYSDVLPKIQCPALIVATTFWIRSPESFKELADAIPHGRFEVLQTGHFAAIESPELVMPVLTKFLKETKAHPLTVSAR